MRILFCGDIMPGGVLAYQKRYISDEILAYMHKFDLRVGTLEAAIGTNIPYDSEKMRGRSNIIYARNEDFFRVKEMGFDVVSLANNHVFDLGVEGLENTIRLLRENGIQYCGAGMDIEEASKPAVVHVGSGSIAVLACCMYGNPYLGHVKLAGPDRSGVNPLDIERIVTDIKKAKAKYDYVVVMPHWGIEYQYFPMVECKRIAYRMVDAGADVVIGSHPHNIQPRIKYRSKYIYFSLGNFLFPDYYMEPPRPIWYPDEEANLANIETVVGYPAKIEKPVKSVWIGRSRIGMVVRLCLGNNELRSRYELIYLSKDNVLHFYRCANRLLKRMRLMIMGFLIKSICFETIYTIYNSRFNLPRRLLHFASKKLRINYDVRI